MSKCTLSSEKLWQLEAACQIIFACFSSFRYGSISSTKQKPDGNCPLKLLLKVEQNENFPLLEESNDKLPMKMAIGDYILSLRGIAVSKRFDGKTLLHLHFLAVPMPASCVNKT